MGVEYRHYFVPADPTIIPAQDILVKIDSVLKKWGLKETEPAIVDLTNGQNSEIEGELDNLEFNHGIALEYESIEGSVVSKVAGPSYHKNIQDADRYIQGIGFIAGIDYRIHPSGETTYITVVSPPKDNGVELEAHCDCDEVLFMHDNAYTCQPNTTPPEVDVEFYEGKKVEGPFHGFWRCALRIDFGKDLPKFCEGQGLMENNEFVNDLEQAFGCKLVQIGEIG